MKKFDIDRQTLDDLNIYSGSSHQSVFELFNSTITVGGWDRLNEIFRRPISDVDELTNRQKQLQFFISSKANFHFKKEQLDYIEFYLRMYAQPVRPVKFMRISVIWNLLFVEKHVSFQLKEGIVEILLLLQSLKETLDNLKVNVEAPALINTLKTLLTELISSESVESCFHQHPRKIGLLATTKCDYVFRSEKITIVKQILELIYEIDALSSVARAAIKNQFQFPKISESSSPYVHISSLFHPFLTSPVSNDAALMSSKNVCFITGANMAGKSTFLKAIGIAVYLAHLGFPVPAAEMEISVLDGIATTINLPDDLGLGRSHYYNEVLRLKTVAEKIKEGRNFFVIFDELFRGTNVKDAYDSSLAIIELFTQINDCLFVVSTHIVEVAEKLVQKKEIDFKCFKTEVKDGELFFDRKLKNGISEDRFGFQILKNENVIDILQAKASLLK